MANQKLSELSAATALSDSDQLYVNDGGVSKSIAYSILRDNVREDVGSGGKLGIATSRYTSFRIVLSNLSSVIKHHMEHEPDSPSTSPLYAACINGPSLVDTTTPNGADSSTAFAAGAKIGSANTNYLWLDTADLAPQAINRWSIMATLMRNSTGTPLLASIVAGSININGVTRLRPAIRFEDHSGNAFAINTTNIAANKILHIDVWGFVPNYA